jgi:hypothetical protein
MCRLLGKPTLLLLLLLLLRKETWLVRPTLLPLWLVALLVLLLLVR